MAEPRKVLAVGNTGTCLIDELPEEDAVELRALVFTAYEEDAAIPTPFATANAVIYTTQDLNGSDNNQDALVLKTFNVDGADFTELTFGYNGSLTPSAFFKFNGFDVWHEGIRKYASDGGKVVDTNTGAVQADDGGNARGEDAVDLQTDRSSATQVASAINSAVLGGRDNTASANFAVVAGGSDNTASGYWSSVLGGTGNTASGAGATVLGGGAGLASGDSSTVVGGADNTASGDYSLAAGRRSKATHDGSMVLSDSVDADSNSTTTNELTLDFANGINLGTFKLATLGGDVQVYLSTLGTARVLYNTVIHGGSVASISPSVAYMHGSAQVGLTVYEGTTGSDCTLLIKADASTGKTFAGVYGGTAADFSFGIGTNTPTVMAHIVESVAGAPSRNHVIVENPSAATAAQVRASLQLGGDAGSGLAKGAVLFATSVMSGFADYEARRFAVYTGASAGTATERLTILPSGYVGIGTVAPESKFHFATENSSENFTIQLAQDTAVTAAVLVKKSRGTLSSYTALSANDKIMSFNAQGYGGTTFNNTGLIEIYADTIASDVVSGYYQVRLRDDADALNVVHYVSKDGEHGIGTSDPQGKLDVRGQIVAGANNAYVPTVSMLAYSNTTQNVTTTTLTDVNVWTPVFTDRGVTHSAGVFTMQPGRMYLITVILGFNVTSGSKRTDFVGKVQANVDSGGYSTVPGGILYGYARTAGGGSVGAATCQAILDATSATTSVLVKILAKIAPVGDTVQLQSNACSLKVEEIQYG